MVTSIDRTPMIREKFLIVAGTSKCYRVAASERGSIAVADTGYPGLLEVELRGDTTQARPQRLHLTRSECAELAAQLMELSV